MTTTSWYPTCLVSWPALSDFICSGDLRRLVQPHLVTSLWLCENDWKSYTNPREGNYRLSKLKVLERNLKAQVSFDYQTLSLCFYRPKYGCVNIFKVPYPSSSLPLKQWHFGGKRQHLCLCWLYLIFLHQISQRLFLALVGCYCPYCYCVCREIVLAVLDVYSTDKAGQGRSGSFISRLMDLLTFT